MEILIDISGWAGMLIFLWAYYLVSTKKIEPTGRPYQILNLIGAVTLGINVFYKQAWPSLALEVVWSSIAIVSLLKNKKS